MEWKEGTETLPWLWEHGEETSCPVIVCLAGSEAEGKRCMELLSARKKQGAVAVLMVSSREGKAQETAVGNLLFALREKPELDENRFSLTAGPEAADQVWKIASHFPQWFSCVCAVGGYGDPYEARSLKDVPLRIYPVTQEDTLFQDGKLLVAGERMAMGLRAAGSRTVECKREQGSREEVWEKVFQTGETVEWMLSQNRKEQFQVYWLQPGVWRIDDYFTASCYLVEGKEKALLIDTGMGEGDLLGLVTSLTRLPVEVAITHPHLDHMHWIDRFSRVYLHKEDIVQLRNHPESFPHALSPKAQGLPEMLPLEEGTVLDLGGVTVETRELPGHTPHSVVFLDDVHRCLFTGDAIGSGYIVLMICPEQEALQLVKDYRQALEHFLPQLARVRDYAWLGGHGIQENGCDLRTQQDYLAGHSQYFNPIREEVVRDMMNLCDALLSGEISWEQVQQAPDHYCSKGCAGMYFRFV